MNKIKVSDEELIYCLKDEWETNINQGIGEVWQSTQGFLAVLHRRGIIITWPSLKKKMRQFLKDGKINSIMTSVGMFWGPNGKT